MLSPPWSKIVCGFPVLWMLLTRERPNEPGTGKQSVVKTVWTCCCCCCHLTCTLANRRKPPLNILTFHNGSHLTGQLGLEVVVLVWRARKQRGRVHSSRARHLAVARQSLHCSLSLTQVTPHRQPRLALQVVFPGRLVLLSWDNLDRLLIRLESSWLLSHSVPPPPALCCPGWGLRKQQVQLPPPKAASTRPPMSTSTSNHPPTSTTTTTTTSPTLPSSLLEYFPPLKFSWWARPKPEQAWVKLAAALRPTHCANSHYPSLAGRSPP